MGIVWILGAGFSKPLGGPLLPQLLSRGSEIRIRAAFPEATGLFTGAAYQAIANLLFGHGWHTGESAFRPWQDAEEFLELLDRAGFGEDQSARRLIRNVTALDIQHDGEFREVAVAAKRLVAAECCAFLKGAVPTSEKWSPYVQWAGELQQEDTVVTFNYDRVVDTAAEVAGRPLDLMLDRDMRTMNATRLLKLHGSVDWQDHPERGVIHHRNPNFTLAGPSDEIAMASPGPSKQAFSEKMASLWTLACDAIASADAIVFVGYRFPQTDATARERILRAITDAEQKAVLRVFTVLGPERDPATRRLEEMLRYALRRGGRLDDGEPGPVGNRYTLSVMPLWAEDFLSIVSRKEILGPVAAAT